MRSRGEKSFARWSRHPVMVLHETRPVHEGRELGAEV